MNFQTIKQSIIDHKVRTGIITIIVVVILFFVIKALIPTATATTYTLGTPEKGTIVSTVSGTGQISSTNQIAVQAKSSGTLTSVRVTPGQTITRGQTLAVIDNPSARLSLEKAKNDLQNAEVDYANTEATQNLSLHNQTISLNSNVTALPSSENKDTVTPSLSGSYNSLEQGSYNLKIYACQTTSGACLDVSGIESQVIPIVLGIPAPLGTRGLYITFTTAPNLSDIWTVDVPSKISNGYLSDSQSIASSVQQNTITLNSKQQAIANAKINLMSAEVDYSNTIVSSPIDGQVGQVSVVQGQPVSTGTAVATLVTKQLSADIPFNEIDVAKIHVGDKATATFDAVSDLTLTGRVLSVDLVGTVSSGVVNYNVKIGFDTEDVRVKSGMSVSVAIATEVHQDVITVPSGAVKTKNGSSYVLSATSTTDPAPQEIPVTVGISDDMNTEIVSGLTGNESIVTRTITSTAAKSTTTAPSIFSAAGARTPTGGAGGTRALGK